MANAISPSPASVDELVAFIVSVVDARYRESRRATNGADLAEQVRRHFPELRYEQLGLLKLADAVAHGESKGLLVRNRRVKHLEVLPAGAEESASSVAAQLGRIGTPHIRPDIWRAFVFISPDQKYCYDRETGNVVNELSLGEPCDRSRFVPIPSVSLNDQRQWMTDFLESNTKLDRRQAPIQDQYCFTKFPLWLREQELGLERSWKQFRVHRVAEIIRQWSTANSIDATVFFSAPLNNRSVSRVNPETRHEEAMRAAIISAARELPLNELQDIAIPIRYILHALKGR